MLRHLKPNKVKCPAEILLSRQLSSVDYEGHRSYEIKLQNYRSVSTQHRQRTDSGTLTGKLCAHAGTDVKDRSTATKLN